MNCLISSAARWAPGLALLLAGATVAGGMSPSQVTIVRPVTRAEIVAAMREETGYSIDKTTHAGRFQGGVYLKLAEQVGGGQQVIRVAHEDWFEAFLQVAELTRDAAPIHVLKAYESRQDAFIDPRPDTVVARVRRGPHPRAAVNVRLAWPQADGAPDSYWFEDTLSRPQVEIHNSREVTFRLLDFGTWMMFDEVKGSRIRPTTGALATVFRVIGLAALVQVRMSSAPDGTAVARATARKALIRVNETITVSPDGHAVRGVPQDRADLEAVERRLRQTVDVDYLPLRWDGMIAQR